MNVANIYRRIKQILNESNVALANKGLNSVNSLSEIPVEIGKLGTINRLPFVFRQEMVEITEDDLSGATHINRQLFRNSVRLVSATIPSSVSAIGSQVFYGCYNLKDIYLKPTTPPTLDDTSAIPTITTIHVPIGSGEVYRNATNWSSFASKIVEDIVIE